MCTWQQQADIKHFKFHYTPFIYLCAVTSERIPVSAPYIASVILLRWRKTYEVIGESRHESVNAAPIGVICSDVTAQR